MTADAHVHVRVVDLHKRYGEHRVLDGVTFDVERGLTNMILGASGSGKTVLLRQLLRLERPDCGRIEVDGEDIVALDDVALSRTRRKFGVVFQDSALFDSMSVFENVAFPLREREPRLRAREVAQRVLERLESLGVADARDKLPAELSGGMKKRVAVARAMVTDPAILVYDEPTRGLDPILSRSVDELIETTRKRYGVTSIVITHDMKSVVDIAHRVNLLYDGRIETSASCDEFLRSDNPRVRSFLDASGVMSDPRTRDGQLDERERETPLRASLDGFAVELFGEAPRSPLAAPTQN